jgi:hypothetical protein
VDGSASIAFVIPVAFRANVTAADGAMLAEKALRPPADRPRVRQVQRGPNCYAIELEGIGAVQAEQQDAQWCWAACAQMVNAYRARPLISKATGEPATQAELARYYKGDAEDQRANLALVIRSLAPELEPEIRKQRITLGASLDVMSTDALIASLSRGELGVLGLTEEEGGGHAYVAVGAVYSWLEMSRTREALEEGAKEHREHLPEVPEWARDPRIREASSALVNDLAVHEVTLFDPWDGSLKTLSGTELARRCQFILTPDLARKILQSSLQSSLDEAVDKLKPLLRSRP